MSAAVAARRGTDVTGHVATAGRARRPGLRAAVLVGANVMGVLAFAWPFLLPLAPGVNENHKADGPLILAGLVACVGVLLFVELGRGGLGPKTVALLGILGAAMVALRLPGFILGFTPMFIVVLVAGNAFGPGFGFLLGAVGMFASGLFIGGLGPWLPFEMVAVGWVGVGAGLLPNGVAGAGTEPPRRRPTSITSRPTTWRRRCRSTCRGRSETSSWSCSSGGRCWPRWTAPHAGCA